MTTARGLAHGAVGVVIASMVLLASPAMAQEPVRAGHILIEPQQGGSSTSFAVRVPNPAECPGDSPDDGYRVNSYMVPWAVDPATITYDGLGPTPPSFGTYATFRQPLFDIDTNSYVSAQTADAERPHEPGRIINIPNFKFAVYEPGDLPVGRYHVGIACTLLNKIATIWDSELVVTESKGDTPGRIHWHAVGVAGPTSSTGISTVLLIVGAAGAALVLIVLVRRSCHSRPIAPATEGT